MYFLQYKEIETKLLLLSYHNSISKMHGHGTWGKNNRPLYNIFSLAKGGFTVQQIIHFHKK